jgi:toxin FitB
VAHRLGLLDTSVVIDRPDDLEAYAAEVGISAVTVGELAFGLHTANPIKAAERERRYREVLAAYTPIPYDAAVAHWFGAIAAAVQRTGRKPRARTSDLMIAATARHVGAVVLTHNPNDFKGVEGIVEVVAV